MRIIAHRTILEFISRHPESRDSLQAWYAEAKRAAWTSPQTVTERYPKASLVGNHRVVFNICGNQFRLVCAVNYQARILWIKFLGTHQDYDRIDVETYHGNPT